MCGYPLRVNNTDKTVPASLQQDDKGRQFRLQMIILLEGTRAILKTNTFLTERGLYRKQTVLTGQMKNKMFLFPLVRRPVIIVGTYDVAKVCKVDIAQCKTRVRMVRP